MPGWSHGAERSAAFAAQDEVGGEHDRARSVSRRRERMRVHRSIGIETAHALFRARRFDRSDVGAIVNPLELLVRDSGRVVVNDAGIEPTRDQAVGNGIEPIGTLRVMRTHVVLVAGTVCNEGGGHANSATSAVDEQLNGVYRAASGRD